MFNSRDPDLDMATPGSLKAGGRSPGDSLGFVKSPWPGHPWAVVPDGTPGSRGRHTVGTTPTGRIGW